MTPLAPIVSRFVFAIGAVCIICGSSFAEKPKPVYPATYSTPSPNGQYLFVMLAPPSADPALDPDNTDHAKMLRQKYPSSGLYRNDGSTEPLWTADWYAYYVHPADDGIHLVREDSAARTLAPFISKPLPQEIVREQLDGPALTFLANGQELRTYTVRELVADPDSLPHSVAHVLWMADATITRDGTRFVLTTQDAHQIVFDLATGEEISRRKAGLGGGQIWVVRGMMALIGLFLTAAVIRWLVLGRKAQGS
jgi:hypothetical protein